MHQIHFWRFLRHIETFLDHLAGVDTPVGRVPTLKTGLIWANTCGKQWRSISQLLLRPHVPNTFWMFLRHIGTLLDYLGGVDTPLGRVPALKTGLIWANACGSMEVNIPASIKAPCTKYFWRFLRHIGPFLDHLTGGDTPANWVPVPKTGLNWANTWQSGEVNISVSIRAPCTKFFRKLLRHIGILIDHLRGVDTPVGRVHVPRNKAKVEQIHGSREVNISAYIRTHTLNIFGDSLRHIETFVDYLGGVDTHG